MKKRYFIFGLLILVLFLGTNFYHEDKIIVQKKEVNVEPTYILNDYDNAYFTQPNIVVDYLDENENPMDVTMKLIAPNDIDEYLLSRSPGTMTYRYNNYIYSSYEELKGFFSERQKNEIDSIHTFADVKRVFRDDEVLYCSGWQTYQIGGDIRVNRPECFTLMPTVYILEETNVPEGYSKKKYYIPGAIQVNFGFPNQRFSVEVDDSSEVEIVDLSVYSVNNNYYMDYGIIPKEDLMGTDINEALELWNRYGVDSNNICLDPLPGDLSSYKGENELVEILGEDKNVDDPFHFFREFNCPIKINKERGKVKLEVIASVNNEESTTTEVNQAINYKVIVKNTGTQDAFDSIVTAKLPEGLLYVEESASNKGVHKDGVVTWEIARIAKGENLELTFKAIAPKGVNTNISYVGEAIVENDSIEGRFVQANKTYVKLSLTNPYTYNPIRIIIVVIALIVVVFGVTFFKDSKIKEE